MELDAWDKIFAAKAGVIVKKRRELIKIFNPEFCGFYRTISSGDYSPEISYKASCDLTEPGEVLEELVKTRRKDILTGSSSLGPQRDDYVFSACSDSLFVDYASQGEKRTASISLKAAEKKLIESITGKKTVLIVDDVLSELDVKRRKSLIKIFMEGNQVIITMADITTVDRDLFPGAGFFKVSESQISAVSP